MQTAHADRVLAAVASGQAAARSKIAASWQRCHDRHRLDPTRRHEAAGIDSASRQAAGGSIGVEISPASRTRSRFAPQRATGAADISARV
ncbi:hypothetical protein [Mangrovicoccus ximenensis]|uniref:hypothetical protein n=1 Tax=Mangrovicoccus ximenensis TaxID=1911570 RepID=UPI001F26BFA3|nr:hypothetical protein [Mangrovicoccus ximenensis]